MILPLRLHLVKGVCVFRCNLLPALLAEWPGFLLRAIAITRGWNGLRIRQHTKFTQEKKILPPLLPGFELITFRSRVRCSNQQAIPVPVFYDKAFNLSLFCVFIRYRVGGLHPQSDMVVVVVVAVWWLFPSLRGFWENGGRMLYHSFPACSFLSFFFCGDQQAHSNSTV